MHILHISSDFCNTKVHLNLYQKLSDLGLNQTIYCPVRSEEQIGRNRYSAENTNIIYDFVVKPYHRYVYHLKRLKVFHSLQNKVDVKNVDLIHAATLFSDGGQAYKIFKKYHVPYVVAVRNTDINGFLDLLPNTWPAGIKILRYAEKIFFISIDTLHGSSTDCRARQQANRTLFGTELHACERQNHPVCSALLQIHEKRRCASLG